MFTSWCSWLQVQGLLRATYEGLEPIAHNAHLIRNPRHLVQHLNGTAVKHLRGLYM